jgi:hypothetical protein
MVKANKIRGVDHQLPMPISIVSFGYENECGKIFLSRKFIHEYVLFDLRMDMKKNPKDIVGHNEFGDNPKTQVIVIQQDGFIKILKEITDSLFSNLRMWLENPQECVMASVPFATKVGIVETRSAVTSNPR